MFLSNLSQEELTFVSKTDMESSEVVKYFYDDLMKMRTFPDVLRKFTPGKSDAEIKELLRTKFSEYEPALKPDSVRKNIDNWFNGREPNDKATLIKICFALGLVKDKAEEARHFMKFTQESDFHLRDPEDAAFLYCLRVGKSYEEAENFVGNFPMPLPDAEQDDRIIYTEVVAKALSDVFTDEEFKQFYRENLKKFGKLRNTAYDKFKRFLKELTEPDGSEAKESYATQEIVDSYLRMKLPLDKKTAKYDAIQKSIRAYWPNRTDVIEINNRAKYSGRKIRKTLLLLYVATEGLVGLNLGKEDFYDSEEMFQGLFMEHVVRINLMLDQCGLARLDPRNPFDWLILYCLKTDGDGEGATNDQAESPDPPDRPERCEGMTRQLQDILKILFPENSEPEDISS